MPYITQTDLEERLSPETVRGIYDDERSGTASAGAINRLIADATSKVDSYLRGLYALPLTVVPNEVKRLTLDVAEAFAAKRHPEYVRRDWKELLEVAERDLEKLRTGKTRLDVQGVPEPAPNQGAQVRSGNVLAPDVPPPMFKDGLGDF